MGALSAIPGQMAAGGSSFPSWLLPMLMGGGGLMPGMGGMGGESQSASQPQGGQTTAPMQPPAQTPQLRTSMMPEGGGQGIPPAVLMQMLQARQPMMGGGQMMGMPQAMPPGSGQGMPPPRPMGPPMQPTGPVNPGQAPGAGPIPDPGMMDRLMEFLRNNPNFLSDAGRRMDMQANMPRQQTMPMQPPQQLPPFILSLLANMRR